VLARPDRQERAFDLGRLPRGIQRRKLHSAPSPCVAAPCGRHAPPCAHTGGDYQGRGGQRQGKQAHAAQRQAQLSDRLASKVRATRRGWRHETISKKGAPPAGFEWDDLGGVSGESAEELGEAQEAGQAGRPAHAAEELADVLHPCGTLAPLVRRSTRKPASRHLTSVPGSLLPRRSRPGRDLGGRTSPKLEDLWRQAKAAIRAEAAGLAAQRSSSETLPPPRWARPGALMPPRCFLAVEPPAPPELTAGRWRRPRRWRRPQGLLQQHQQEPALGRPPGSQTGKAVLAAPPPIQTAPSTRPPRLEPPQRPGLQQAPASAAEVRHDSRHLTPPASRWCSRLTAPGPPKEREKRRAQLSAAGIQPTAGVTAQDPLPCRCRLAMDLSLEWTGAPNVRPSVQALTDQRHPTPPRRHWTSSPGWSR